MKKILLSLLTVLCSFSTLLAQQNNDQNSIIGAYDLNRLIEEALQRNPQIQAYSQNLEASKSKVPQAGAWMDPKLNFNIMNFPVSEFGFDLEPMTSKQLSIMQKVPFPGITRLKTEAAEIGSRISGYLLDETKNKIINSLSLIYYDLFFIDMSIETTTRNKQLLANFLNIANKKYEVGKGLQQDVLKAQVEISKLTDKLINLSYRRRTAIAKINALVDQNYSIEQILTVEYFSFDHEEDQLLEIANKNRPLLNSIESNSDKQKKLLQLSRKQYWPSLDVSLAYSQRDDRRDFISAQFSMSLPIWQSHKQDKNVEESIYNLNASENMYLDASNHVKADIISGIATLRNLDERMSLLKDIIIPQASQSLNSAISGYEVDKVDFLTLLNNQISLFNLELDYFRLLSSYRKSIANIEFTVGKKLIDLN